MSEHFVDPAELKQKLGHDTLHPGPDGDSWQGGDSLRARDTGAGRQGSKESGFARAESDDLGQSSEPAVNPGATDKLNEAGDSEAAEHPATP
ncbi:hypothetical protein JCM10207_001231 [Rhodosporidiobolus poonsookiae]